MDIIELYGGSFVNWETVADSWRKRTVGSRLLLLTARRYLDHLETGATPDPARREVLEPAPLPEDVKRAFAAPPPEPGMSGAERWGEFVDAAVASELEMISYGERPPLLYELRAGLEAAARAAGAGSHLGRWFSARRDALPGEDLPEDPGYLPV